MPILDEERVSRSPRRRRGARGWYVLLVPPVLLLGLVAAAIVRPVTLQFGPMVVLALTGDAGGGPNFGAGGNQIPAGTPLDFEGKSYVVTGGGWGGGVIVAQRGFAIAWFRGHRK